MLRSGNAMKRAKKNEPQVNRIPFQWALLVGLLAIAAQAVTFYLRFDRWNTDVFIVDYLLIFLAGALGGLILIYFLNRQPSLDARFVVVIAFLLASPIALFMMIGGGLLGIPGILILPQIPWTLFTWIGSFVGQRLTRS
jgi:hypothetical protein